MNFGRDPILGSQIEVSIRREDMADNIQIIEKPDGVTWDDIKQCLVEAHTVNRAKGINMSHYQWPTEKIKESLGEKGIVLVALDGRRLVGTAAIGDRVGKTWYTRGSYAYICFDAVIPEYSGKGIFKLLDSKREQLAMKLGYKTLVFDTHSKNVHRQEIAFKNGFRLVRFFRAASKDHYSVVMAKWLDGRPYTKAYCWWKYYCSLIKVKTLAFYSKFIR